MVIRPTPTWSNGPPRTCPNQIADFNAVTNTNNPAAIRFAVCLLNSRWKEGNGYEAELVTGRRQLTMVPASAHTLS